jgi:hypothetical protein
VRAALFNFPEIPQQRNAVTVLQRQAENHQVGLDFAKQASRRGRQARLADDFETTMRFEQDR